MLHVASVYPRRSSEVEDDPEKFLLMLNSSKFDPNLRDHGGESPIYTAAKTQNYYYVHCLLRHKDVDVNIATDLDDTPLALVLRMSDPILLQMLLHSPKIDPERQDDSRPFSGLKAAIVGEMFEEWEWLVERLQRSAQRTPQSEESFLYLRELFDDRCTSAGRARGSPPPSDRSNCTIRF